MYHSNMPTDRELPSTASLIKSTIIAAMAAGALLITTVLPAEYGIDPTGIGQKLGLKKMGEIKTSLAAEAAAEVAQNSTAEVEIVQAEPVVEDAKTTMTNQDRLTLTLAPNEGKEAKVNMQKDAIVTYRWSSDSGIAKFDIHGDSRALKISYHNYEKGAAKEKEGEIKAAFDGSHGWFWRNRTDSNVTITLDVSGDFTDLKLMK